MISLVPPPERQPGQLDVTVTFLEMRRQPGLTRPPPPRGRLMLMQAAAPPLHFYRYLYLETGRDHLWTDRLAVSDNDLREELDGPDTRVFVLWHQGCPVGFAELRRRRDDAEELQYFGLLPEGMGRGWGRFFLGQMIDIAWQAQPGRVVVQTCTLDHPRALPLYQSVGFEVSGRQTVFKDDPRLTGLLPKSAAPQIPLAK